MGGKKKIPGVFFWPLEQPKNGKRRLNKALPVLAEENEFILYATRYSIHRYDLASGVSEELPLAGLRGAVALDFDYDHNCLYWADITLDIIQVSARVTASLHQGRCCVHTLKCKYLSWVLLLPALSVRACLAHLTALRLEAAEVPHLLS